MKYRNAKRLADGRIDCEIDHPAYGWIPFTSAPDDIGAKFDAIALFSEMDADPVTAPYVPPTAAEAAEAEAERMQHERAFMRLSFAQLLIGLVSEGWITAADGRAWRDRVALPAQVQAVIASLPKEQQFAAETRALAPSEVLRNDPLVSALSAVAGKSSADLDAFFRTYAGV